MERFLDYQLSIQTVYCYSHQERVYDEIPAVRRQDIKEYGNALQRSRRFCAGHQSSGCPAFAISSWAMIEKPDAEEYFEKRPPGSQTFPGNWMAWIHAPARSINSLAVIDPPSRFRFWIRYLFREENPILPWMIRRFSRSESNRSGHLFRISLQTASVIKYRVSIQSESSSRLFQSCGMTRRCCR